MTDIEKTRKILTPIAFVLMVIGIIIAIFTAF